VLLAARIQILHKIDYGSFSDFHQTPRKADKDHNQEFGHGDNQTLKSIHSLADTGNYYASVDAYESNNSKNKEFTDIKSFKAQE
jgi:hypothetical protein